MRILHTSDWHLGQKFIYFDREEEHRLALEWILELIDSKKVELVIIAGDIFDIGNPPNYARSLYYNFLRKLLTTSCRHVVIIGGNHDSPSMLEAPKALLKEFKIHVIGSATGNIVDEIIELKNDKGELEAVIAAVPFLRDRDLRSSVSGETGIERIEKIREGILNHYVEVGKSLKPYAKKKIPLIVTGHLFAMGSEASEKQNNIYIGDKENIKAGQFPKEFDYIALGHIHRNQMVGGLQKVRYSGSIIPLSFSETRDEKSVNLLTFSGKEIEKLDVVPIPVFRRLKTITGSLIEVQEKLELHNKKYSEHLTSWVEIIIDSESLIPNLDELLRDFTKEMNLEILKIRLNRPHFSIDSQVEEMDLSDLKPLEVFRKKCKSAGQAPEEMEELEKSFLELQNLMNE